MPPHEYVHRFGKAPTVAQRPSVTPSAPHSAADVQLVSSMRSSTASQVVTLSSIPQKTAGDAPERLVRSVVGTVYGRMQVVDKRFRQKPPERGDPSKFIGTQRSSADMHSLSARHAPHRRTLVRGVVVHVLVAGSQLFAPHALSSAAVHRTHCPA